MQLIDYTHPAAQFNLKLTHTRGSALYYTLLDELPSEHPAASASWALFRRDDWLEGGSAWLHAKEIDEDLRKLAGSEESSGVLRPVVGSGQPSYDEALAQALATFGWRAMVAEKFEECSGS